MAKTVKEVAKSGVLTAYNMKLKQKNVPFAGTPEIIKNGNKYRVMGKDAAGNNMAGILSETNALAAIKSGNAVKSKTWA